MKEEYPFLFGRLGKILNTRTIYSQVNSWVLYLFVKFCEVLVDYSKKNILAYVTHTETCLKSTKLAGKYIQLTWCFTYIMCLRSFSPFGVCSTTQVQCPPGIGWSFQEPWMAMKTILRRAAPISFQFQTNMAFQKNETTVLCGGWTTLLKHMLVNKLKKHLWTKKTPFFVHSSWMTLFHTFPHYPFWFNPFRPIWMNASRSKKGCKNFFINIICFCGGSNSNNLSFFPESKTCKYWSVSCYQLLQPPPF